MRKRTHRVQVMLSDSEYLRLCRNTAKSGFKQAGYLRSLINGYVPKELPPLEYYAIINKLYLITDPHDPQLPALFAEEIARHQEKQEYLQARAATLAACPPEAAPGYGHQRILAHAILRETLQLRWLKKEYHRLPRK